MFVIATATHTQDRFPARGMMQSWISKAYVLYHLSSTSQLQIDILHVSYTVQYLVQMFQALATTQHPS